MKTVTAYALVSGFDTLPVMDEKLPLFWMKSVANDEAAKWRAKVVKVQITPVERNT